MENEHSADKDALASIILAMDGYDGATFDELMMTVPHTPATLWTVVPLIHILCRSNDTQMRPDDASFSMARMQKPRKK